MPSTPRSYDLIVFGDEVPGVLALVAAAREHRRQTRRYPRSLLLFKGSSLEGIGGHLVRGKLAYLDRSSVPPELRRSLGLETFGDPSAIYQEFLQRSGVVRIALDPRKADATLRQMLTEVNAAILSRADIESVLKENHLITGIRLTNGDTYWGKQFVDATVNAELAQYAGAQKLPGFAGLGLANSELPVTLVFETEGITVQKLQQIEYEYLQKYTNRADISAQKTLNIMAGDHSTFVQQLHKSMIDPQGKLRPMFAGVDYIDVRSKALSIAYHAFRGTSLSLEESGAILDNGNIALLSGGRLSWNALLCKVSASEAEAIARADAKPTASILQEFKYVEQWFKTLGATAVSPGSELYIRHAGNVTGFVEPLSGAQMLAGGVPNTEALGTFGYAFDVRGGIAGIEKLANEKGINSDLSFTAPLFNIGIRHALMKVIPNLAVVSPASGFDGYACATGRIVEFNVAVGQGVGIACTLALRSDRQLADITNGEVRKILEKTGQLPKIYGRVDVAASKKLNDFESRIA
ncbi:MAG: FAD-dependent oxidoreductase [Leptolyngbyaceae cyanobacterium CSU_1_4]|nr:FAD-dependent oxidoreductase [Leptolyngbyaceae cyanobacterium CSU_1_4]